MIVHIDMWSNTNARGHAVHDRNEGGVLEEAGSGCPPCLSDFAPRRPCWSWPASSGFSTPLAMRGVWWKMGSTSASRSSFPCSSTTLICCCWLTFWPSWLRIYWSRGSTRLAISRCLMIFLFLLQLFDVLQRCWNFRALTSGHVPEAHERKKRETLVL